MAKKTNTELKEYFKAGKRPTESQFGDFIDSFANLEDPQLFPKSFAKKSLRIEFPHNVSNQAVDILLGNRGMSGWFEIEIAGTWMYWNSVGNIKKLSQMGFNPDNDVWYTPTSRIVEAGGLITEHIYIGDIVWDANIHQYKITIYHTHHSGNIYDVRLTHHSPTNEANFSEVKLSDVYTNSLSGQKKHYVNYNDNVGIKTKKPEAPLDIQGKILFDIESPVIGGTAIRGYETMWARGYNFISSDGTQNIGGFAAVGEQNKINHYYIGKYENKIVSFNPENKQSSFNGNIEVYGEAKSRSQRIFDYSPTIYLDRSESFGGFTQGIQSRLLNGTNNWFFGNLGTEYWLVAKGTHENALLTVRDDGNVGVGTMNPLAKLDVAGGINVAAGSPIQLGGHSSSHGLKYKRFNSDNSLLDGPFLYGWTGGALGIKKDDNEFNVLSWKENGNVAIQGKVEAKEFRVSATPTADHVFASDYNLRGIHDLEKFITEKSHLPEIPSAKEMTDNGLSLGDFQIKLLQKIEELTLYIIALKKEIDLKPN